MKPLQHVTILDLSRVLACPFASMILAELGAHRDQDRAAARAATRRAASSRSWSGTARPRAPTTSPATAASSRSPSTCARPKARRSSAISPRQADVLLENFPVGTLERYGLDYRGDPRGQRAHRLRLLHRLRPDRPVRAPQGLRHHLPGHGRHHEPDRRARRRAGEARPAGRRPHLGPVGGDRDPRRRCRGATRQGSGATSTSPCSTARSRCSRSPPRAISRSAKCRRGSAPSIPAACRRRASVCADGDYLHITASDQHWLPLCRALGLEAWGSEPELQSNSGRLRRRDEVMARLTAAIAARTPRRARRRARCRRRAAGPDPRRRRDPHRRARRRARAGRSFTHPTRRRIPGAARAAEVRRLGRSAGAAARRCSASTPKACSPSGSGCRASASRSCKEAKAI